MAASPSAIGVRLLTTLAETVTAAEVADVVRDLMKTTSTVRTGSDSFKEVTDYRAREAGAKLYFGHMLGLPVQRSIEIQHREERNEDTWERLLSSPAARAAMMRALGVSE